MPYVHPAWEEHQRQRWMRPDAERYLKPPPFDHKAFIEEYRAQQAADVARAADAAAANPLDDPEVRRLLAEIKLDLLRWQYWRKAYNPNQPRVPAGNPDGGEWTRDGAQTSRIQLAQARNRGVLSDIRDGRGDRYYNPGGHHEMVKAVYKKWNLHPETRKIFDEATTGKLDAAIRTTPDGPRIGNIWEGAGGGLHRAYNDAVEELTNKFIQTHNLKLDASDMTPDHARVLLKQIRESDDPRIRDFNANMRLIRRLRQRRGAD